MVGIIGRGGRVACGIGHAGGAPGDVGLRGGGVAAPVCVRVDDTAGGVLPRGAGGDTGGVFLLEYKAIHHDRFGGDVGGRDAAVLGSLRIRIINAPLRGSQAAFADGNHFTFQRGAQLRDELLLLNSWGFLIRCSGVYSSSAKNKRAQIFTCAPLLYSLFVTVIFNDCDASCINGL